MVNRMFWRGCCLVSAVAWIGIVLAKGGGETVGAENLVRRVAPGLSDKVAFCIVPRQANEDEYFELSTADGVKLCVRGNSRSALCAGFGWYLRNVMRADYFWEGAFCDHPATKVSAVVALPEKVRRSTQNRWRVNFNFCTISYSLAFADWRRWERELDILALHGVNLPLTVVGLECTWFETLRKLGWSDGEARRFLVGPPFQAWQWMTNMESENGPIPKSWIDRSRDLGRRLIAREQELGMTPLQEGFTGCLPHLAKEKFPNAKIADKEDWFGHVPAPVQLDPLDPLFPKFAKAFYDTQREIFGAHGFYAIDPFHEGVPPVRGDVYLKAVGNAIARALIESDPKGVACMQSWSLRMPIAKAFPHKHLLILDISGGRCEKANGFDGIPFVSGLIWNFGGRTSSGGNLKALSENPFALTRKRHSNCIGAGLFPEGIHTSPLYFDLAYDLLWEESSVDPHVWLMSCLERRYETTRARARELADLHLKGLYSGSITGGGSVFAACPRLRVRQSDPNRLIEFVTNGLDFVETWRALQRLAEEKGEAAPPGLTYDLVDVARATCAGLGCGLVADVCEGIEANDRAKFDRASARYLDLIMDLDSLLAKEPLMDFAVAIHEAEMCGTTDEERELYSRNEALLVTQWGPFRNPSFYDYAWREWSGLLRGYYLPRWKIFLETAGTVFDDPNSISLLEPELDEWMRPKYRANGLYRRIADFEEHWIENHSGIATTPVRSAKSTLTEFSARMLGKWSDDFVHQFRTNPCARLLSKRAIVHKNDADEELGGRLGR